MRRSIPALSLALLCFAAASGYARPPARARPISCPDGQRLAEALDKMDVENHWLPKHRLKSWRTGEPSDKPVTSGAHTHCSAFVAAFCKRQDVPILSPPPQTNLANMQRDWLEDEGREKGWRKVSGTEAQRLANLGVVVVASFKNTDPKFHGGHGHIAIIRPSEKSEATVCREGPQITQAGGHNYNSAPLTSGFASQPIHNHQVLFYAYKP